MQGRICTAEGCNAKIGGQNHVVDKSNTRLSQHSNEFQGIPGYHMSVINESKQLCLSDRILRLLIHGLMEASTEMKYVCGNVAKMMSYNRTSGLFIQEIKEQFAKDFEKVKKSTGFPDTETSLGVHIAMSTWSKSALKLCLSSGEDR